MSVQSPPSIARERVPPLRRRRKRSVWRKTILPAAKYVIIGTVLLGIAGGVTGKIARPFGLLNRESRETRRIASDLQSLRKENAILERRIKYLQTPEGAAHAARKLGYVKPGEITLVLPADRK